MYCKHCGNQIADDSVFCSKCGKLVIEAYHQSSDQPTTDNVTNWITTENLQWKKPTDARYVQIIILVILGLLMLYPLYCFVSGGKVNEYSHGYGLDRSHEVYVKDHRELKILKFTTVKMSNTRHRDHIYKYSFTKNDAQEIFRLKMLLVLVPFFALFWITIKWIQNTRFPREEDIVPRDVADEIEQYMWDGFTRYKYVFYKKDGKYGIIDARNYCVNVPAQYDSIVWRMPNKTFDVTNGGEKKTMTINNLINSNTNRNFKAFYVFSTSLFFVCSVFALIVGEQALPLAYIFPLIGFSILTYFAFKKQGEKENTSDEGHTGENTEKSESEKREEIAKNENIHTFIH